MNGVEKLLLWITTCLSVIGAILNVKKKRSGFMFWIIANSSWAGYHLVQGMYPQAILFFVYLYISITGFFKWKK